MDYSSQSKLLSCPRQYELSELQRLAPAEERRSRHFGDAWHRIMYQYGKGTLESVDAVLSRMGWEDPLDGDYRTAAKLNRGFQRYIERYIDSRFKYIQLEQSFKMHVGAEEPWEGRKDAVVLWDSGEGKGQELWVVDYKTTSRMQANWVEFYRNSNQFKGYFLSAREEWPELAGVVVDVYHATKGAKSGKSFEELEGNRFYRLPIRYEGFTLNEAKVDFITGLYTAKMYREMGHYPKNTSACTQFGTMCPFLELCDAKSEEARERLKTTYGVNTFDPHAPLEE
jgi:hypothetical protein